MSDKPIIRKYTNGEITIVWEPAKCIHAGICVHELPAVYNPKERPWVKIDNATTNELEKQINNCPSGALSYYMDNEKNADNPASETKIKIKENGPLLVEGNFELTDKDGATHQSDRKITAFCRCGASKNKPYCDGAHRDIGFKG